MSRSRLIQVAAAPGTRPRSASYHDHDAATPEVAVLRPLTAVDAITTAVKPLHRGLRAPSLLVGAVVAWNLVNLRAETLGVSYLDDSSVHEQMVRFATFQLGSGHLPLTSWFPYIGLGSPQFLHYQSLPAMLTGLIGLGIGPNAAFRWTLYLLLSVWPVSVYLGARLFGTSRWAAAASAAMSPFLMSATGVGYEQTAYVWAGYGVWAQLWASMALPLAWGLGWRAIRDGRDYFPATFAVSLTVALHFETGYLALMPLAVWPLVSRTSTVVGVRRAAVVICGALISSVWVIVPLIAQRNWAATNEILHGGPLVNGYGAGRVLSWLVSGQLLDASRLPVVTLFAAVGLALACTRWRKDQNGRALVVALAACLLLSFGRTSLGVLVDAIPASGDLFFRRFMMGIQLAAVLLAGTGILWCWQVGSVWLRTKTDRWRKVAPAGTWSGPRRAVLLIALSLVVLAPAWLQLLAYDRHNAASIQAQAAADRSSGAQIDRLVAIIKGRGDGRVYAGMPSNWGAQFAVGAVPVFKYLESKDVDEVGYTLRTASLMTDPEFYFDERNAGDYQLFGIRYLIRPVGRMPPIPARLITCAARYCLWSLHGSGYLHVGTIVGTLTANRSTVGVRSAGLLRSPLVREEAYLRLLFGSKATHLRLSRLSSGPPPGFVDAKRNDLQDGVATATLTMDRAGIAVLSTSFDPGWRVKVDGRPQAVFPVAPALAATDVPAGTHTVTFSYTGFSGYVALFTVSGLALILVGAIDLMRRANERGKPRLVNPRHTGNPRG